jgi:hypothetical protein
MGAPLPEYSLDSGDIAEFRARAPWEVFRRERARIDAGRATNARRGEAPGVCVKRKTTTVSSTDYMPADEPAMVGPGSGPPMRNV